VLLSGYVSAIAVWTRAMLLMAGPVQMGLLKGWYLVPPMNVGQWISLALFGGIIGMGLIEWRFWCKYLCPTGAVFSLGALLSFTRRKVSTDCISCGQCETVCDFGAIREDFSTRHSRCSFCQSCGGVCPVGAIDFTDRWSNAGQKPPPVGAAVTCSRRSLLVGLGTAATAGRVWLLLSARMALAVVDKQTCLPYAGRKACRYCVDECTAAGYEAIEFIRVGGQVDETGRPVDGSGFVAPAVLKEKCVGCGLCQMRCRAMNVKNEHLLVGSAIMIQAGPDPQYTVV